MIIGLIIFITVGLGVIYYGIIDNWDEIDVPSFKRRPKWDEEIFKGERKD